MKNTTKMINGLLAVTATIMLFASCAKDGDTGPAGPAGQNGTNGTNGVNGQDGNSNVKIYYFGPDTLSSTVTVKNHLLAAEVTQNMIDSSLVLLYYQSSTFPDFWYAAQGIGPSASFQTRWYVTPGINLFIELRDLDGTAYSGGQVILKKLKLVVAPSSAFSGNRYGQVDYNDYKATMKFLGVQE